MGVAYCKERKRAWVLSAWQAEVERYPSMGEKVEISTWATKFDGLYGLRNFCMEDEEGRKVAYANSVWVYVDMEKRDGMVTAALGKHQGTGRDFNHEVLGLDQGGPSSEKRAMH